MLKSYKTEIRPTKEQQLKIHRTIGTCRFVYNFFLAHNNEVYKSEKQFVSANEFSKWLNNVFIPNNQEYSWIKEVSSKSVKQSILNAEKAYKNFFKKQSKFPRFKKKKNNDVKMYFVKTDAKSIIHCERHRIKIPTLGWIQLKEYGYLPTDQIVKSGNVSYKAGRYYVNVLVDENVLTKYNNMEEGIGIDLGVKDFAIVSNGKVYKNINKAHELRQLNKKLRREQRKLSRKYENIKKQKGEATRQNLNKQILVVQKLHQRLSNIRSNYHNQIVSEIVKTKPSYITIEDLNVRGMMKNRHLSKAIQAQGFYSFTNKLITKAHQNNIEVRKVDRWYPSSKTCHNCGQIKSDLKLSDRVYVCDCGYVEDRDLNAAMNLRDATEYKVA